MMLKESRKWNYLYLPVDHVNMKGKPGKGKMIEKMLKRKEEGDTYLTCL